MFHQAYQYLLPKRKLLRVRVNVCLDCIFDIRRDSVHGWKDVASKSIIESEDIISFAEKLLSQGIKVYDALHLSCAYCGGCDYFLTVDKHLLKKSLAEIRICNPIDFVSYMEV